MDYYIVAIGGTGVRIVRSIVHLAGARVFEKLPQLRNINVMIVDSDTNNGDMARTINELNVYNQLYELGVMKTKITLTRWSPLNVLAKRLDEKELMDHTNLGDMKSVYEFLYTANERSKVLNGGFYSHTSIGSYYMNFNITDSADMYIDEWKDYFANIQPKDYIMLVGSIFGGTGASGVPTLARTFRKSSKTTQCRLGGVFVGPYFRTKQQKPSEKDLINWESFSIKAKVALNYYETQNIQELFSRMYFLGEYPSNFMITAHNIDAKNQINKANTIELYGATALVDFITDNPNQKELSCNVKIAWRGTENNAFLCSRADLNTVGGQKVYRSLAQFFAFSVFYKNVLYPAIIDPKAHGVRFKKYYNFNGSDALKEYCDLYINWIREMITETDKKGHIDLTGAANGMTDWFAEYEWELYDGINTYKNSAEERSYYIDRLSGHYAVDKSPETPGFEHIVRTRSGIQSAVYIYSTLCNANSGKKNLRELVNDIIELAWGGSI